MSISPVEISDVVWHARTSDTVLSTLETRTEGLTDAEASSRLEAFGPNTLPRQKGATIPQLLFRQINDPLIYVLLASAALAFLLGKGTDGGVVLAVVIANMIIGFVQEFRAGKAIAGLIDLVPDNAVVMRNGRQVTLPSTELVPGDIVMLQPGDKVPADMRILSERNLRIEEAALTGESVPVDKGTQPVADDVSLGDRHCMAFSGTLVTAGNGTAVVTATGDATELGKISSLLRDATETETPLTRQIGAVGKQLTIWITVVAVLLFLIGLYYAYQAGGIDQEAFADAVLAAITLAVAAIPEGLPAIITIALAIGVQRMASRQSVIRKLPAVETLGSTTVICSDKTGTLTRGEMTVQRLWTVQTQAIEVTGAGYAPEGDITQDGVALSTYSAGVTTLLEMGILCNDSALTQTEGRWEISGDPTEGALIVSAAKASFDADALKATYPRIDAIPFESERQYMATLHDRADHRIAYIKGAPERILSRCDLSEAEREQILGQVERFADEGMRVLAFGEKVMPGGHTRLEETDLDGGVSFVGLQAMIDPPRPEAIEAIEKCHHAGITVKMITGDHQITAAAIGRQLGIAHVGSKAYTGREIEAMTDEELQKAVHNANIFARVAPEHKLRLVRALQAEGDVAAMTGDGVNDAPALKQADIGVAMGITGTAVSKDAADMVLTDDNFSSIAAAVEEGRRVYDNLVKSLAFVLPTNIGEALIILLAVLFPMAIPGDMPMLPTQILWINLVATVALALPLAFEVHEPGIMSRKPRDPKEAIMSPFVVWRTVMVAVVMTIGALALYAIEFNLQLSLLRADASLVAGYNALLNGASLTSEEIAEQIAQTVAVTTVIFFQIFYLIQCRSLKDSALSIGLWTNPFVYIGIVLILVLQFVYVYWAPMHIWFHTLPLSAEAWGRAALAGLIVVPIIVLEKMYRKRTEAATA